VESAHTLLAALIRWEVIGLIGGLGLTVMFGLLTGKISARHLLWGTRKDGSKYFSPERVQLLLATIAIAVQYVLTAAQAGSREMPKIPDGALELLGVSNAVYLGGKSWTMLRDRKS
jgi:hypothetical protein